MSSFITREPLFPKFDFEFVLKNKLLSAKAYEQAIGFMRVEGGTNILDTTDIHPESYDVAKKIMNTLNGKRDSIQLSLF